MGSKNFFTEYGFECKNFFTTMAETDSEKLMPEGETKWQSLQFPGDRTARAGNWLRKSLNV
jgi:hypothetical protein